MNVLVTGGTGFVGTRVVHALRARGHDVRALVRRPQRERTLRAWGCELVALDDHGTIVGHAVSPTDIVVADDWTWSGLRGVLAGEVEEG